MGTAWLLHGHVLLHWYYTGTAQVLHGYCTGSERVLQGTALLLHGYCTVMHGHCTCTARVLHGYCTGTALALHCHCLGAAMVQNGYCTGAALPLLSYCTGTALVLHWYCTGTARVLRQYWTVTALSLHTYFTGSALVLCTGTMHCSCTLTALVPHRRQYSAPRAAPVSVCTMPVKRLCGARTQPAHRKCTANCPNPIPGRPVRCETSDDPRSRLCTARDRPPAPPRLESAGVHAVRPWARLAPGARNAWDSGILERAWPVLKAAGDDRL